MTHYPQMGHIIGLDGLRGVGALLVLFKHVGQHMTDASQTGVLGTLSEMSGHGLTLFFALSGFLIYLPFAKTLLYGRTFPDLRRYVVNRVFRIFPAYLVIFILAAFVFGTVYAHGTSVADSESSVGRITDPTTTILNLFLVQTYVPGYIRTGIGPAWSLTSELAFYMVLPVIVAGTAAIVHSRRFRALLPPLILIAVSIVTTTVLGLAARGLTGAARSDFFWGQTWTAVIDRSLLSQGAFFAFGMLATVVWLKARDAHLTVGFWPRAGITFLALVSFMLAVRRGLDLGAGVAAMLVLLLIILPTRSGEHSLLARFLESPVVLFVGHISLSIYLWHHSVIWWLQTHGLGFGQDTTGLILNTLLVSVISICLSAITYFFVEKPTMDMRGKITARWQKPASEPGPVVGGATA